MEIARWLGFGQRWRTTVAGSCENGRWNWKTAGGWVSAEDGERMLAEDGERQWRARAWWSTVGRKWVDEEREGKFGGKLGGNRNEQMGYCTSFGFKFQISKFFNFFFFKILKLKMPFPRRKGPGSRSLPIITRPGCFCASDTSQLLEYDSIYINIKIFIYLFLRFDFYIYIFTVEKIKSGIKNREKKSLSRRMSNFN
jgi:hypothetical protein